MRTTRALLAVLAVLSVAAAGCAGDDTGSATTTTRPAASTTTGGPTSTVATGEVAEGLTCQGFDQEVPRLEPVEITRAELDAAGCEVPPGGAVPGGGTLWLVRSGVDRLSFTLTSAAGSPWVATLEVPAPGCAQTMEWRGEMVLVLASDSKPDLRIERVEDPCG